LIIKKNVVSHPQNGDFYNVNFVDQSILYFDLCNYYTFLTRDFDPIYSGGRSRFRSINMKVTYWLNKCGKKILRDKAKEESLCPILPDFISIQI